MALYQMTAAQVYTVAARAGFQGIDAVIATAITMPESGAHPGIIQANQPYSTTGWGLWQITPGNSVPQVGIDNALLDPQLNANAAFIKYRGSRNTFRPWTTYRDGAYRPWMNWAQNGANQAGAGGVSVPTGGGGVAIKSPGQPGGGNGVPANVDAAWAGLMDFVNNVMPRQSLDIANRSPF